MHGAFPRSRRALRAGRTGVFWPLAIGALFAGWFVWSLLARVTVYATSHAARLEVALAACPVETPVEGHVATTHVELAREVEAGQVLLQLDAEPCLLARAELLATRASRTAELEPLAAQIAALERRITDLEAASLNDALEQDASVREAEAALDLASSTFTRAEQLAGGEMLSAAELAAARAGFDRQRAAVDRQRAARDRVQWERRADTNEWRAELAACRHRLAQVRGELAIADAAIARLTHEIERRTIRAPVAGMLGESTNLRPGQFVARGARIAAIVPAGGLRIVAAFAPQEALGRVRTGQPVRLRLHGFPWAQFGTVSGSVTAIAGEALAGTVRVEASIDGACAFPVPLQHGWPGTLEVEVETVSPATLLLRAAGAVLAQPESAAPVARGER